ncbi:MAG: hypothetical protein IGS39_25850 [Calothrix sp. C42_A2020_038]|nr:hypothetical protein [Calothrix sp. C42_A2020_038]
MDAGASPGNNRFYGGTGNDTFTLGEKDTAFGEDGDDRFFATSGGGNVLTGGSGKDQFWIASAGIPDGAQILNFSSYLRLEAREWIKTRLNLCGKLITCPVCCCFFVVVQHFC